MKNEAQKFLVIPFSFSVYYLITGLWPMLHIGSFIYITGPKTDIWLVKTVGVLITALGATIFIAARRKKYLLNWFCLPFAATGLSYIDIYYVFADIISPIYLLDAIAEILFIVLWIVFLFKHRRVS